MCVCATAINRRKAARNRNLGPKTSRPKSHRGRIERVFVDTGPKKTAKMGHRK